MSIRKCTLEHDGTEKWLYWKMTAPKYCTATGKMIIDIACKKIYDVKMWFCFGENTAALHY